MTATGATEVAAKIDDTLVKDTTTLAAEADIGTEIIAITA